MTTIPVEVSELTPSWFSEVLQAHAPGSVVSEAELVDKHSGTTGRAQVALTSSDDRVPASVFVKLAPFTAERRAFVDAQGMGVAEARFYSELAADVPVRKPFAYYAGHDADGRYVMVFEDLAAAGARFPTQQDAELERVVDGAIDNFATMHAAFTNNARFDVGGDLAWIEKKSRGYGAAAAFVQHAVAQLGDEMPQVFHDCVAVYVPNDKAIAALLAEGDRTLVHGDSHIGNMFVEPSGVGFLDWAVFGYAPGIRDLAYFISNSVTTEFRREHERRLIERYCAGLAAGGVALSADAAWEQYRLQNITGWIAAVVTAGFGSELQPIEIGMRATKRANIALEDLEVVDLLASRLGV